jgi:4-hydroxy 2-oxovalerate aldolase
LLVQKLHIPVGFHAHNNLGLSVANSLAALRVGARILDGTACGFGAGAGNAPIELVVAAMQRLEYPMRANLYKVLDAAELAAKLFTPNLPVSNSVTVVSGLAGVFSGFAKPVQRISTQMKVDPRDVFFELGKRQVVGGQEDLILQVAHDLAQQQKNA